MDIWTRNRNVWDNPAMMMAAMWYIAGNGKGDRNMVIVVNSVFWIIGGLLFAWFREKQSLKGQEHIWRYGSLSGVLVAGIVFTMAAALQFGEASIVLPIAQMSFLLTFACSAIFLKEKMTRSVWVGIVYGIGAVLLLSI